MKIFITGANRGLGLALAKTALERGHEVFAGARSLDPKKLSQLKDLQNRFGAKLIPVEIDVSVESAVIRAFQQVKRHTERLDAVINNAGILMGRERSIADTDLDECMDTMNVNAFGPLRVIKHFLPLLKKGDNPTVINVSSDAGSISSAYGGDYAYGLSKAALNMLTAKAKKELKASGIRVFSVHPGWMRTDMGGPSAEIEPEIPAAGICKMIEFSDFPEQDLILVDYEGKPMDI
ncbi:MAG: SDR family oxidoreductase [Bacillaceae bacterium]|jgi:NAD(P)-dependent dehydrogenase (short-subunit alcohol dehydrogenase family)